ncbi:MAG: AMP-binding protein [bacterium]
MITDISKPITSLGAPDYGVRGDATDLAARNGLSHVIGELDPPLWRKTIPELLADTVAQFGTRTAAIFAAQDIRWSYRQLAEQVDCISAGLLAAGLAPGDRIGIWSPNRAEWIVLQYASAHIGLVLVNINPAYRVAELEYALNKVSCKALVLAAQFKSSNYIEMLQSLAPELTAAEPGKLHAARLPNLRIVVRMGEQKTAGMFNYSEIAELGGPSARLRMDRISSELKPDDAINIQFTSGTTGAPKGATLTHLNIINNARFVSRRMNLTERDLLCIPVPLYHCFGMVMGSLGCVSVGAAMVFPGEGFEARPVLECIQSEGCTALYGVPTMFVAMLEEKDFAQFDLRTLRTGIMAGAPCPIEIMRRVTSDMHMPEITIAYGMTETSPVSFQSHTDDPIERRVATTGRVHPHVEVKITDDSGAIVPVAQRGELCTRGYSVMQGYWDDKQQTDDAIDGDGWMHTGDLAVIDADGYCSIIGRLKDMVIRGGENIYPREIEEYLFRHPAVQEAQVFGLPDEKFGEELCAWLVLKSGHATSEDDIRNFCKGQIAHYKIPRYIRFKDALPATVTGKPQKFVMREQMIAELQGETA